jgi:hypothetical protein
MKKECEVMKERDAYKKGFDLLMEYWDSLPDEDKPSINKKLEKWGI